LVERGWKCWCKSAAKEAEGSVQGSDQLQESVKGKYLAMDQLYGPWGKSFHNLFRFKAQLEQSSPDSVLVIDHHTINNKVRFNRLFFALKACVDGFLRGCILQ
jgi:hypothetical protein